MSVEKINLALRAATCPRWRWMPGMRAHDDWRVLVVDPVAGVRAWDERHAWATHLGENELPDLDDPATLGCLLALVREAWGCDEYRRLTVEPAGAGWCVVVRVGKHRPPSRAHPGWSLDPKAHPLRGIEAPFGRNEGDTETEALVAALEAVGVGRGAGAPKE